MKQQIVFLFFTVLLQSYSYADTYPEDVASFIEKRDLCDHLRGEISGDSDIDDARDLNKQLDKYCKGTDQLLNALKVKYKGNTSVTEKINTYDLIECLNNCNEESDAPAKAIANPS